MDAIYHCENQNRLDRVRQHATLNGIEWLEVLDGRAPAGSPRQQTLLVHFAKPLAAPLDGRNVRVEAPPRAAPAPVVWAGRASDAAALFAAGRVGAAERDFLLAIPDADATLAVRTGSTGDFSTYTLRIVAAPGETAPPPDVDVRLAHIAFRFKVECPSPFDCAPDESCPDEVPAAPTVDYLAKDFASFRRLMLDRMSVTLPAWQDRSAADMGVALVELMAYVGDHLSYAQDAVATEAYLGTARRRVSVRRHARLLDYAVHEGTNARAWVHLRVVPGGPAEGTTLPAHTALLTAGAEPLVFETMHSLALASAHNGILFYTWEDDACCLAAGATRATLLSREDPTTGTPLTLAPGDVLVFEETVSPTTGLPADADPGHRHAVRLTEAVLTTDALTGAEIAEVAWHQEDALPFPLCLSARVPAGAGTFAVQPTSIARGNIVLADAGQTVVAEALEPAMVAEAGYRPRLRQQGVAYAEPYSHAAMRARAATTALRQDPRRAMPARLTLDDGDEVWQPRPDLLGSSRFAPEFVLETEGDGRAYVRFGDDVLGKAPSPGATITATYRVGGGSAGNVGAEAISYVVGVPGIEKVRNPLPAVGGSAPEPLEAVRLYAPQAFRTQERAVTESDYARIAERLPGVQRATARYRWTGSWLTVFLTVDREGGLGVRDDPAFLETLRLHLERYRMAGFDVEIGDPAYVPLEVEMSVCVAPGYFRADVQQALLRTFSRQTFGDGTRGFFHPDAFTFGQPVYLSQLYQRALALPGVASVEVTRFQRHGKSPAGEREAGVLQPSDLEVIRLDNDPSAPENGRLTFTMAGGV